MRKALFLLFPFVTSLLVLYLLAQLIPIQLLPLAFLGGGIIGSLLLGILGKEWAYTGVMIFAIFILSVAFLGMLYLFVSFEEIPALFFKDALRQDSFSYLMNMLVLAGAALSLLLAHFPLQKDRLAEFEYAILILLSTFGMMVFIGANNFIALYLGLELMSLPLYVLAAFNRHLPQSAEGGIKYFVLGAVSSALLLYGLSLLYGFSGTVSFALLRESLPLTLNLGIIFGFVLLLVGLAFKVSLVPFHMWTPDVYEGAPLPVTTFFATAPKIAAFAVFARVLIYIFPDMHQEWQPILLLLSGLSMTLGALAGIGQTNIKRLMAYSSIGHMGFATLGLCAGNLQGVEGIIFYMLLYLMMSLGMFGGILLMRREGRALEEISDFAGLSKAHGGIALCLAILLCSLIGLPPLGGFFAKFYVFSAAIDSGLYALACLGMVATVISAFYYLKLIKIIYMDPPDSVIDTPHPLAVGVLTLFGLMVVGVGLYPAPWIDLARKAAQPLF